MNKIKRFIERQCEQYETWITETKEALAHAPEGSLKIRRQSGHIRYACKTAGGKEKYISSNDEVFIRALAQKGYQQKLLFFSDRRAEGNAPFSKTVFQWFNR